MIIFLSLLIFYNISGLANASMPREPIMVVSMDAERFNNIAKSKMNIFINANVGMIIGTKKLFKTIDVIDDYVISDDSHLHSIAESLEPKEMILRIEDEHYNNVISVMGIAFCDTNHWSAWINGVSYNNQNMSIDRNCRIIGVSDNFVTLLINRAKTKCSVINHSMLNRHGQLIIKIKTGEVFDLTTCALRPSMSGISIK